MIFRNLFKKRRFRVRHKKAEALLKVAGFSAFLMDGRFGSECSSTELCESPGRFLTDGAEGNQLIIDMEYYAVMLEKACIEVISKKMKSMGAGKMGMTTTEVGDCVVEEIGKL